METQDTRASTRAKPHKGHHNQYPMTAREALTQRSWQDKGKRIPYAEKNVAPAYEETQYIDTRCLPEALTSGRPEDQEIEVDASTIQVLRERSFLPMLVYNTRGQLLLRDIHHYFLQKNAQYLPLLHPRHRHLRYCPPWKYVFVLTHPASDVAASRGLVC